MNGKSIESSPTKEKKYIHIDDGIYANTVIINKQYAFRYLTLVCVENRNENDTTTTTTFDFHHCVLLTRFGKKHSSGDFISTITIRI
jgi:hypothetical protein